MVSNWGEPRLDTDFNRVFCDGPARVIGVTEVPADTKLLHFVPASFDLSALASYRSLRAISFNNVAFSKREHAQLLDASKRLKRVKYLTFWNCKHVDHGLFVHFPAVEYLQLTHSSTRLKDWSNLSAMPSLCGLFLIDANDRTDLGLLRHVTGPLAALSVIGAKQLTKLNGIEQHAKSLTHLTLHSSKSDRPKTRVEPLSLRYLARLTALRHLDIVGFTLDPKGLTSAKSKMPHLPEARTAFFRIIGEYGGRDSEAAVKEHHRAIRKAFEALALRRYSKDIDAMRLVLCIGGKLRGFDLPAGMAHPRISKKDRYAYAEIVLHPAEWKKGKSRIKAFLTTNFRQAVVDLCTRLEKAKLDIQTARLLADVDEVLAAFNAR